MRHETTLPGGIAAMSYFHVNKNLPNESCECRELQPAPRPHTRVGKFCSRKPRRPKNSFIVAKPFEPSWFSCNPGALLLLPPSLVRAGALRSIFIFRPFRPFFRLSA
jgi:hypothetical protein